MQLPTLPRSGDEQGYPDVVLGFWSLLGSEKPAQTGLAVADADIPSAACLVPNAAVPALPALLGTRARHSQDREGSVAANSCFPFLTPPEAADLLTAAERG